MLQDEERSSRSIYEKMLLAMAMRAAMVVGKVFLIHLYWFIAATRSARY